MEQGTARRKKVASRNSKAAPARPAPQDPLAPELPKKESPPVTCSPVIRRGEIHIELSAPADYVFRLRISRSREFATQPSWMIQPQAGATEARVRDARGVVSVGARGGTLWLDARRGTAGLRDASGREAVSFILDETGFRGEEPRATLRLREGERVFGLGEQTGPLDKRGLIREFWNTDVICHVPAMHAGLRSLYVSVPFALSLNAGAAAGLFWDNSRRQTWDIGQTRLDRWEMRCEGGDIDLWLLAGPEVPRVVEGFAALTGRIPLPPLWALGYHQCRYSYETQKRAEEVAAEFRKRRIPCDALYLDIHHMAGFRVFTFGPAFPGPAAMIRKLARNGFNIVTIVDPGVKDDPKFPVCRRGMTGGFFVKTPDGKKDYIGAAWPGPVRYPDFFNSGVRGWWAKEQVALSKLGVAGFWNDMNEPANFAAPGKTLPDDALHGGDGGQFRHRDVHNVYGAMMARASREGALLARPNERPFVISRAGCAGIQRHALVWTGDNSSTWEHLAEAPRMLLNMSLSGLPFCGSDTGGFLDNCTPELLARWTQMAAFTPFFRNHTSIGTVNQEPWAFGPKVEAICREFINLRYQLLPYIYALFHDAHSRGAPMMRPLFWSHQDDARAAAVDDQFYLGPSLMIAPVLRPGQTARMVYLPRGLWRDFWTGESLEGGRNIVADCGLERIPVYAPAGALVPTCATRQFTGVGIFETIHLRVWAGAAGFFSWVEDDGSSMEADRGVVLRREIAMKHSRSGGHLTFSAARGLWSSQVRQWRVTIHGLAATAAITIDGKTRQAVWRRDRRELEFAFRNRREAIEIGWQ